MNDEERGYSNLREGVLTLSGFGLRLEVERGHLVVEDGVGQERRTVRFSRIDRDLKRVVIIGHSGAVSLGAIAWLHGVRVPLIHLDHDGRVYFVSAPGGLAIGPLRRAQAGAADNGTGLTVSRALLAAKIKGQLEVLPDLPDGEGAKQPLEEFLRGAEEARQVNELRDCEARAARTYWRAWRGLPIRFAPGDAKRCPAHWLSFGTRISPLTGPSPRRAVNPANAVLNYLYAILEAEAHIAALGARLDPTLGVLHADRPNRASLACDLMEPVRPSLDAFALSVFREHTFSREDAFELEDGHCRLLPPFTHLLSATAALWAERVRPVADEVAKALVTKPKGKYAIVPGVPMALLGARRKPRGRTALTRRFESEAPAPRWSAFQEPRGEWRGTHSTRKVFAANRAWDRQNGLADRSEHWQTIQPGLRSASLRAIVAVTGLSKTACAAIRKGTKLPHPRHWEALRKLSPPKMLTGR